MRILADVNVLVSSTIAPLGLSRTIITAWREGRLGLVTSPGLLAEFEEKLRYPRIGGRYGLTEEEIQTAVETLRTQSEYVAVPPSAVDPVTGDPEDDYVLATVVIGQVDYLVTGDHGLQQLGAYQGIPILSPRAFLEIFTQLQNEA